MSVSSAAAGLLFGLSLIVAIGPQNAFVLRQGARRSHVGAIVAICSLSDAVLIAAGVGGMGAIVGGHATVLTAIRLAGATVLAVYALTAARDAARPPGRSAGNGRLSAGGRGGVLAACVAFTWLNPAVYLDTVVLLGTVAASHPVTRWSFGAGAAVGSVVWFAALGYGAWLLAPVRARPRAARALDAFVAAVMALTAVRVLLAA